jgi:hypothetical protein
MGGKGRREGKEGGAGRERRERGEGKGKGLSPSKVNFLVTSLIFFLCNKVKKLIRSFLRHI